MGLTVVGGGILRVNFRGARIDIELDVELGLKEVKDR